jgi:hypothetical protein
MIKAIFLPQPFFYGTLYNLQLNKEKFTFCKAHCLHPAHSLASHPVGGEAEKNTSGARYTVCTVHKNWYLHALLAK